MLGVCRVKNNCVFVAYLFLYNMCIVVNCNKNKDNDFNTTKSHTRVAINQAIRQTIITSINDEKN